MPRYIIPRPWDMTIPSIWMHIGVQYQHTCLGRCTRLCKTIWQISIHLGVPGGPCNSPCHFSTPGQGWGNGVWAGWHVIASWGWIILWSQHAPNQQKHTTSQPPWDFPRPSTPGWNCWPHLWGNLKLLHELPGHNSMQTAVTGRNSTECWFNCSTQQGI